MLPGGARYADDRAREHNAGDQPARRFRRPAEPVAPERPAATRLRDVDGTEQFRACTSPWRKADLPDGDRLCLSANTIGSRRQLRPRAACDHGPDSVSQRNRGSDGYPFAINADGGPANSDGFSSGFAQSYRKPHPMRDVRLNIPHAQSTLFG